ncbi:FERM domain-containing protein 8 [Numida meleagris]|uniref:FERM domain-containing protein 8 n=1 Tax=Numida meleagris TaxID=8996 RepID=UPI000B3D8824|nr:FERM domain-containing protein 8 [Numida meleagris]
MEPEPESEPEAAASGAVAAVRVFLPDGSVVPLALPPPVLGLTAAVLLRCLWDTAGLGPEGCAAMALWLVSGLLEVQLKPRQQPFRLRRQWAELVLRLSDAPPGAVARDEPCLHLRRNVFFPKHKELELQDEAVLRLLVAEARGHLRGGRWPLPPEEAAELGGLQCRLRLGPFQPGQHSAESLRPVLEELLPPAPRGRFWGSLRRRPPAPPPEELLSAFSRTPGPEASPGDLLRSFLQGCHRLHGYGCAFFPGAIDRPPTGLLGRGGLRPVSVAVGLEGVTIIDAREKHVLLTLSYPELSWELVGAVGQDGDAAEGLGGTDAAEPPQLWLEFDGEHEGARVNRLLRVLSPQAELMSALIDE